MFIKATYSGQEVLLNSDYIVDIWHYDSFICDAYVLDNDRACYKVAKQELNRLLESEE